MSARRAPDEAPYLPAIIGAVCASWFAIEVLDLALWVFR